jgi:diadenosine tetraphosphate (Ap4A) HIT family hydrolase
MAASGDDRTPVAGGPVFGSIDPDQWITANDTGFAVWDRFPVGPGHALVVPRRRVGRWWDLTPTEQADLMALTAATRSIIDGLHHPDGYNIGINDGAAAGQTVDQLHIHLIPRYAGDVADPRGGIRHVIAGRGNYLS